MINPLRWQHAPADIPDDGLDESRSATAAERAAIAEAMNLLSCETLNARYEIRRIGDERFRMTGEVEADVVQACVISLEPVTARICESLSAEFHPEDELVATAGESSVLGIEDIEPLEGGRINVGRMVFEVLSAALDPYPRKPGAEFTWQDRNADEGSEREGPFAALGKLKRSE